MHYLYLPAPDRLQHQIAFSNRMLISKLSCIPMKALLRKLRSIYYRILNIQITYTSLWKTMYLRLWFSMYFRWQACPYCANQRVLPKLISRWALSAKVRLWVFTCCLEWFCCWRHHKLAFDQRNHLSLLSQYNKTGHSMKFTRSGVGSGPCQQISSESLSTCESNQIVFQMYCPQSMSIGRSMSQHY